jgi:hypothetical protein
LFDEEWVCEVWDSVYEEAINAVKTNSVHQASFSRSGKQIISCVNVLNDNVNLKCKLKEMFLVILCDSSNQISLAQMKEAIFSKFHVSVVMQLSSLLLELGCQFEFPDNIVKMTILEICENVIKFVSMRKQCVIDSEMSKENLSNSEQQILMYISGYILHSLQKMCNKIKSKNYYEMNVLIRNVLSISHKTPQPATFVSKYKKWTETLDRGGLTMPNDDFFLLIRNMELVMKSHVHGSVVSKDLLLHSVCSEKIINNVNIKYLWDRLCPQPGIVPSLLLEKISSLFLTVRGHAYARTVKAKLNDPKKGLRKTLKKKVQAKSVKAAKAKCKK